MGIAIDYDQSIVASVTEDFKQVAIATLASTYPAIIYFVYFGTVRVRGLAKSPEHAKLTDTICRGYPEDMVVQMGTEMYDLSKLVDAAEFDDLPALARKIEDGDVPDEFMTAWGDFLDRYGCRGPLEMELANPKYAENPLLALRQIGLLARSDSNFNPHDVQRDLVKQREDAYSKLRSQLPWLKRRKLDSAYNNILRYYSGRELIKHHIMQVNDDHIVEVDGDAGTVRMIE